MSPERDCNVFNASNLVIHAKRTGLTITFQQMATMARCNAEHVRCLTRTQVAVDDILKNFEAVDFFHCEHPGVMYSHRKLLIRKSELLTRYTGLKPITWTFLMSHK